MTVRPTDTDLILRPARDDDDPAVLALLSACLGWTDDARDADRFRWKHRSSPFGRSPAWVAEDEGRIVGYRAFMRWEFDSADGPVRAVRAVDTATDPACRGRGIFKRLTLHAVDELARDGVGVVFNTPNTQSRPGYLSMGWHDVARLPMSVRLRGAGSLPRTARARIPADLWSLPADVGTPAADAFGDDAAVRELLARVPTDPRRWRTHRTPAYLRWRYSLPDLHYRVVTSREGLAGGAVVVRVRPRGPAVELAVCDVLAPDRRTCAALVRAALRASGADHAVALGRPAGMLPVPGQGPRLTARSLTAAPPGAGGWALSLGDIEMF